MLRVILDTNVIVSAVISDKGAPRRIYEAWREGRFNLVTAPVLIVEVDGVLRRPKIQQRYRLTDIDIASQLLLLSTQAYQIPDPDLDSVEPIVGDPADNMFLACCLSSQPDFLVTGDQELVSLGQHGATQIVSPGEFLTLLARDR